MSEERKYCIDCKYSKKTVVDIFCCHPDALSDVGHRRPCSSVRVDRCKDGILFKPKPERKGFFAKLFGK